MACFCQPRNEIATQLQPLLSEAQDGHAADTEC